MTKRLYVLVDKMVFSQFITSRLATRHTFRPLPTTYTFQSTKFVCGVQRFMTHHKVEDPK